MIDTENLYDRVTGWLIAWVHLATDLLFIVSLTLIDISVVLSYTEEQRNKLRRRVFFKSQIAWVTDSGLHVKARGCKWDCDIEHEASNEES